MSGNFVFSPSLHLFLTILSCSHFNLPGGLGGALQMMGKLGISIATVGNGRRIYIIIFIICIVNVVVFCNLQHLTSDLVEK